MPIGVARCIAITFCRSIAICSEPPSGFRVGLGGNSIGLLRLCGCGFWMRLLPQPFGDWQGIDLQTFPPGHLIACLMQLPMMTAAKGYGELVADFETQRSGLRKPQVMRVGRLPATDQAGL
jgi:hypothetical protein